MLIKLKKNWLIISFSIILFSLISTSIAQAGVFKVKVYHAEYCPRQGAYVRIYNTSYPPTPPYNPIGFCFVTDENGYCQTTAPMAPNWLYKANATWPDGTTLYGESYFTTDENGDINGITTIRNSSYPYPNGTEACGDSECDGFKYCVGDPKYIECDTWDTECDTKKCCQCDGGNQVNPAQNYDETQDEDCNAFDIATCFNIPDGYDFTWDYRDSYCTALNTCYEGTITHTCNQPTCSAECDEDIDCPETDCDYLDGCHSGQRYYDCNDVANDCLGTCTCESNSCPAYTTCSQTGTDNDFDGWDMECGDCNDDNPNVNPGATEIVDNGQDDNCDGYELCYLDGDDDGYRPDGSSTVTSVDLDCLDSGEAQSSDPTGDCNDADANVNPGAIEVCNGIDDNCVSGIDEEPAASASCDDSNECTDDQCVSSSCSNSNEPYGTYCGSARNCPDDACNGFFAEFYPIDGNDYCDGSGNCLVYSCDMEDSYCTDNNAGDGVNGLTCGAECDQNIDCSEECIDKKWYSTYSCNLGTCNCDLSDLICSEGHCGAECDYNDDCEGAKACLSDCTCSQIEGDLNGDCIVNILDLIRIGRAFDAHPSDDHWSPLADVVVDDVIDIFDLSAVGSHFGETC